MLLNIIGSSVLNHVHTQIYINTHTYVCVFTVYLWIKILKIQANICTAQIGDGDSLEEAYHPPWDPSGWAWVDLSHLGCLLLFVESLLNPVCPSFNDVVQWFFGCTLESLAKFLIFSLKCFCIKLHTVIYLGRRSRSYFCQFYKRTSKNLQIYENE